MNERNLTLDFGALCEPIKKQLAYQQFAAPARQTAAWQNAADSITLLSIQKLITYRQAEGIRRRLCIRIAKRVKPKRVKP